MVSVSLKDYELIQKHNINMNILFLPEKDIPVQVSNVESPKIVTVNFRRQMVRSMMVSIDTDRTSVEEQLELAHSLFEGEEEHR